MTRGSVSTYYPNEQSELESLPLNTMQLLRIESNIKLNVITWQDEALISEEDLVKPEVHYV